MHGLGSTGFPRVRPRARDARGAASSFIFARRWSLTKHGAKYGTCGEGRGHTIRTDRHDTDGRTRTDTDTTLRPHPGAAARGDKRGEATYTTEGTEGKIIGERTASAERAFPVWCVLGRVMQGARPQQHGSPSASSGVPLHRPPRAGAHLPRRTSANARPLCLRLTFGRLRISSPDGQSVGPSCCALRAVASAHADWSTDSDTRSRSVKPTR
jgi:hypothetical protein